MPSFLVTSQAALVFLLVGGHPAEVDVPLGLERVVGLEAACAGRAEDQLQSGAEKNTVGSCFLLSSSWPR